MGIAEGHLSVQDFKGKFLQQQMKKHYVDDESFIKEEEED